MVLRTALLFARSSIGFKRLTDSSAKPMKGLMPGANPVIRTKQYLDQGIVLRDSIRIMMINYSDYEDNSSFHEGARNLVSLSFSQLQYKNPNVQILCLKNVTPTPFITFFLDNGDRFYVDIEGKNEIEILEHLQKVAGKPRELIELQTKAVQANPANFGNNFSRKCICECEGQVECSSGTKIITSELRAKVGARNRNPNPKKYPFGVDEDEG